MYQPSFFFFGKIGGLPIILLILWPFKAVFDKQPQRYKFCSTCPPKPQKEPAQLTMKLAKVETSESDSKLGIWRPPDRSVSTALYAILLAPHSSPTAAGCRSYRWP